MLSDLAAWRAKNHLTPRRQVAKKLTTQEENSKFKIPHSKFLIYLSTFTKLAIRGRVTCPYVTACIDFPTRTDSAILLNDYPDHE